MDVYNIQQDVISPFRETYLSAVLTELSEAKMPTHRQEV